jgi:uncharacterized protein (DUF1778 family)
MAKTTSGRLELRIRADVRAKIEQAARLVDVPLSDFVRSAAETEADRIVREHAATIVPAEYFSQLLQALDRAPRANSALQRAATRAQRSVVRR